MTPIRVPSNILKCPTTYTLAEWSISLYFNRRDSRQEKTKEESLFQSESHQTAVAAVNVQIPASVQPLRSGALQRDITFRHVYVQRLCLVIATFQNFHPVLPSISS